MKQPSSLKEITANSALITCIDGLSDDHFHKLHEIKGRFFGQQNDAKMVQQCNDYIKKELWNKLKSLPTAVQNVLIATHHEIVSTRMSYISVTIYSKLDYLAYHGHLESLKLYVEKNKIDLETFINGSPDKSLHPFYIACSQGNKGVAEYLLQYSEVIYPKKNNPTVDLINLPLKIDILWLALLHTCSNGQIDIAKWIFNEVAPSHQLKKALLEKIENGCIETIFAITCKTGHLDLSKWLYSKIAQLGINNEFDLKKGFIGACENGHIDIAQWIYNEITITTEQKIMLFSANLPAGEYSWVFSNNFEALYKCIEKGNWEQSLAILELIRDLKYLLKEDHPLLPELNRTLEISHAIIFSIVCEKENIKIASNFAKEHNIFHIKYRELLLRDNMHIIFKAYKSGKLETIQWLIEKLDPTESEIDQLFGKHNRFDLNVNCENFQIFQWLYTQIATNDGQRKNLFSSNAFIPFEFIRSNNFDAFRWALETSLSLDRKIDIITLFTNACKHDNLESLNHLFQMALNQNISLKTLVNYESHNGDTPLEIASTAGHHMVVAWLLQEIKGVEKETGEPIIDSLNINSAFVNICCNVEDTSITHKLLEYIDLNDTELLTSLFVILCNENKCTMLKWFYNLEQLTDEQRVQMRTADNYLALRRLYAAGHPTFETAKWLYKEINPNPEQAANIFLPEPHEPNYFIKVCTSGNVELANWLYFEIVPNDQLRHDLFQSIISNESFYRCFTGLMGSFDIAKWLYFNAAQSLERRNKLIESNFDKITSHYRLFGCNNMTTMKWFYSLLSSTMQSRFLKEINPRSTPPSPADLPFYSWIKSTIISKLKEKYQEVKGKFSTSFQGDEKYHRHYKEFNDDMGIQLFSNKNNKTQSSYDDSDLILKKY